MFTPKQLERLAEVVAEKIMQKMDRPLTLTDVMGKLHKSEEAVRKMVARKQIPCRKLGRALVFSEREINEYMLTRSKKKD